jgi:hypothetical protein
MVLCLDKCPSNDHVLKVWSPVHGAVGRWQNFWEVGPSRRKLGYGAMALGVILGPWPLLFFPIFASYPSPLGK